LSAAAFIANPDSPNQKVPNTQLSTNIAREALSGSLKYLPRKDFIKPTTMLAYGQRSDVPDVTGDTVDAATSELKNAGFSVQVSGAQEASDQQQGRVARTDPAGGSSASKGSVITIYVSNGQQKQQNQGGNQTQSPILQQLCQSNPNLPICDNNGGNGDDNGDDGGGN
jgi:hypothetical protein